MSEAGADNLGLACSEDGLVLGRTPLLERREGRFVLRDAHDLQRLLSCAYQMEVDPTLLLGGLATVAAALNSKDLLLARIAAVHLRIPDLPDRGARERLEAEDRLIKLASDSLVAKSGDWDPALHPRAGAPPNPGWFSPTDGAGNEGTAPAGSSVANTAEVASADETMRPGHRPDLTSGGGGGGFSGGRPVPVQQGGTRSLGNILAPGRKTGGGGLPWSHPGDKDR